MIGTLIKGFPGYTIDRNGDVRSYRKCGPGKKLNDTAKALKPWRIKGYLAIDLYKDGVRCSSRVHRLLAQTFIPNPLNLPCVLHADDMKTNNDILNLRWGTDTDNKNDRHTNTQGRDGRCMHTAKLTKSQVIEIRKRFAVGNVPQRELAKDYGVHFVTINAIVNHKTWAWIK